MISFLYLPPRKDKYPFKASAIRYCKLDYLKFFYSLPSTFFFFALNPPNFASPFPFKITRKPPSWGHSLLAPYLFQCTSKSPSPPLPLFLFVEPPLPYSGVVQTVSGLPCCPKDHFHCARVLSFLVGLTLASLFPRILFLPFHVPRQNFLSALYSPHYVLVSVYNFFPDIVIPPSLTFLPGCLCFPDQTFCTFCVHSSFPPVEIDVSRFFPSLPH